MWWLGHLVLILLVFGLGFSSREALEAWRSLNRFLTHGSGQPATSGISEQVMINQPPVVAPARQDPFADMQSKADSDKLAALRAAMKPAH